MKRIVFLLLLFITAACECQVLKGTQQYNGVNAIPGLVLHWDLNDAAQIITSSGNLVQLNDKGSGANHVIPATSGVRPAYFSSGGPNNRGYVEVASGKTFQNLTLSITTSPLTLYAVVKLPSLANTNGQNILSFGNTGGTNGIEYNTASGGFFRMYTSISPTYSLGHTLPNRTDWQLIKMTIKDVNSFWVEVNNEPVGGIQDARYGVPLTIINRLAFIFPGIKVAEARIYNRILSEVEDQGIKQDYVTNFALTSPAKGFVLIGDSHMEGVTSGTNVLGPFAARMIAAYPGQIVNHGKAGTCVDPGTYTQGFDATNGVYNNFKDRYPLYAKTIYADWWFILQYGTNDSAIRGTGAVGAPNRVTWNANYRAWIQAILDKGVNPSHIVICTPPYSTGPYVSTTLAEFRTDIIAIASEKGLILYDLYQAMQNAGLDCNQTPDKIHMNDDMHTLWYNGVEALVHP